VKIGVRRRYLWRAVDDEGEVLDVLVQKRRNKEAALKLLRKLLRNPGVHPETITSGKLAGRGKPRPSRPDPREGHGGHSG